MKKAIAHLLQGREKHITPEETVLQPLPHKDFRFANPFIVIHHFGPVTFEPGQKSRIHPHPHRGFAPVTFMLQGEGYHKDNAGHEGTVRAGDVQWMFAGKGLLHSEGPSENLLKNGGKQEFIQIWVNVPKAHKWDEPGYQFVSRAQMPVFKEQEDVNLRLVSGTLEGKTGPVKTYTPIISVIGEVGKGSQVALHATPGYWTLLYVAKGSIVVNDEQEVAMHQLVVFEKENDEILLKAAHDSQLLYLSAEPIEEPITAKDNFVMNSTEDIEQAMQDYKDGKFGALEF